MQRPSFTTTFPVDDDPSRRDQPSNHTVYGVDMAILAGDALFSSWISPHRLLGPSRPCPRDPTPESGSGDCPFRSVHWHGHGTVPGSRRQPQLSVEFVQQKKFGEMAECSAVCGGLLSGANEDEIQRLRQYGRAVGVLYQVVDDILAGKSADSSKGMEEERNSKRKGKSYVRFYGIDKAGEIAEELRDKAKKELDRFEKYGNRVIPPYSFVDYAANRGFNLCGPS